MDASPAVVFAALTLGVVLAGMLAELLVSRRNERAYRRQGAIDVPDPVYSVMRWAYPGAFVLMACEGLWRGEAFDRVTLAGVVLFVAGKGLKVWAISVLGTRWTYRVLILPGAPLVTRGPYTFLRHPNYVGVVAELLGTALMMHAWLSGPVSTLFFAELLRRRIAAEERALGLRP